MNEKIENILKIWHKHFENEEFHYSEFESSDIEYFVGCLLYNHFAFSKALQNMKTMDLSYDFIGSCGDEYDEIMAIIKSMDVSDELKNLTILQNYIQESKAKYTKAESYLLDRLDYHISAMAQRYEQNVDVQRVDFQNPLYR
jgi:hypothetical protein